MKKNVFYYYILVLVAALWQTQARAADYYVEVGEVHITFSGCKKRKDYFRQFYAYTYAE